MEIQGIWDPLKWLWIPLLPRSTLLFQGLNWPAEYISGTEWAGSGMSCIHRLGAELLKIRRMQSLWFYLWAVSWTPGPQTVRHVAPTSATVDVQPWQWSQRGNVSGWPCRQVPAGLLPCPIRAKRNPKDTCHRPSMFSTDKETHNDTCHILLSFFLIIPSYSNFTNSVNLYNTSESETYKKSAGNIKKNKNKKTNIILSNINYSSTQNRNLVKFISVFF